MEIKLKDIGRRYELRANLIDGVISSKAGK